MSAESDHATTSVVDAVVASARFPLLFRPDEQQAGACLTDGGLASNLPAFLFEDQFTATRTRTLAFDLIDERENGTSTRNGFSGLGYLASLASCAVEASDVLLRQSTAGIEYYPIPVPDGIGVLSLDIDTKERDRCYDRGYARATELLGNAEWYLQMQEVGEGLQARLILEHGPPDLYEPILRAIMDQIAGASPVPLKGMRANIALVASRGAIQKRIITYSLGMEYHGDSDFEMNATAGCSGQAWASGAVAFADVEASREDPDSWGMSAAQHAKIPASVRALISAPIAEDPENAVPDMQPIGTISVDCQIPLADTGWIETIDDEEVVNERVEDIILAWSRVIHALLTRVR